MAILKLVRTAVLAGTLIAAGSPVLAQPAQQVLQRPSTAPTVKAARPAKIADSTVALAPCRDPVLLSRPGTASGQATLTPVQAATLSRLGADYYRTGDREKLLRSWRRFVVAEKPGTMNIHEVLFAVFKESIAETREDRDHFKNVIASRSLIVAATPGAQASRVAVRDEDCWPASTYPGITTQKQRQELNEIAQSMHDIAISKAR